MNHEELAAQIQAGLRSELAASAKGIDANLGEVFIGQQLYGNALPLSNLSQYLAEALGWVYACASVIADEVASAELHLVEDTKDGPQEVYEHEALTVLDRANNFTTRYDHLWLTAFYLEIMGEAPWYMVKKGSTIEQLILLRPDNLEVIPGTGGNLIDGYVHRLSGAAQTLKPEDVVFLRYPDPKRALRGMGTLEAARRVVDVDNFAETWNLNFFYNHAMPGAILQTDQKLTREQRDSLKKQMDTLYRGVQNAHKTAVLESGLKWSPLQISQKEMDFLAQLQFSRDKILAIFRVPKTALGLTEDVNRANAEATDYVFSKRTIKPKVRRIVEQLNEFYLPMFAGTESMRFTFTDPTPEDLIAKRNGIVQLTGAGVMSINEGRKLEGLDPVEGGDRLLWPIAVQTVDATVEQKAFDPKPMRAKHRARQFRYDPTEVARYEMQQDLMGIARKMVKDARPKKAAAKPKLKAVEKQAAESYWRTFVKSTEQFEPRLKALQAKLFAEQEKKVSKELGKKALDWGRVLLDEDEEGTIGVKLFSPLEQDILRTQSSLAAELIGMEGSLNLDSPAVRRWIEQRTFQFSFDVATETNRLIKDGLQAGVELGEGVPELRKRLRSVFQDFETYRLDRIARTEVITASTFAADERYGELGVEQKEWLVALDENTCEECLAKSGDVTNVGDSWGGDDIPLHPNCRCTPIPVIK